MVKIPPISNSTPQIRQLGNGRYAKIVHNLWGDSDIFIMSGRGEKVLYHREKHVERFDYGQLSTLMVSKHDTKYLTNGKKEYKHIYSSRQLENGKLYDKKIDAVIHRN